MSDLEVTIKVSLNDNLKSFNGKFIDISDVFDKLTIFIVESYELSDKNYIIQYKDDENDSNIITKDSDLAQAINLSEQSKKPLEIFIKVSDANIDCNIDDKTPKTDVEMESDGDNDENNVKHEMKDDAKTEYKSEDDKLENSKTDDKVTNEHVQKKVERNIKFSGLLSDDLCNQQAFTKEFITFLKAIILLYQSGHNSKDKMEFITAAVTAMSQYPIFSEHKEIKLFISKLNVVHELESVMQQLLKGFDANNIDKIVNAYIQTKKDGGGFGNIVEAFGLSIPYTMFNKVVNSMYNDNNDNNNDIKKVSRGPGVLDTTFEVKVIENRLPKVQNNTVDAEAAIIKTWKLKNVGNKSLPKGLKVVYTGKNPNNPMVSTKEFLVGNQRRINAGEIFIVSVYIRTPQTYGSFKSNWRLSTHDNRIIPTKLIFNLVLSSPNYGDNNNNYGYDNNYNYNNGYNNNFNNNNNNNSNNNVNTFKNIFGDIQIDDNFAAQVLHQINKNKAKSNNDSALPKPDSILRLNTKVKLKKVNDKLNGDMKQDKSDDDMDMDIGVDIDMNGDNNDKNKKTDKVNLKSEDENNSSDTSNDINDNSDNNSKDENDKNDDKPVDNNSESNESYEYEKELLSLKSMGFAHKTDVFLKGLLAMHQGQLDQVINTLLN